MPSGTTGATLAVLTRLIHRLDAKRVVFLGDFLHSARSLAPATLAVLLCWRELHRAVELTLVRGNHDERAGGSPALLEIQPFDAPMLLRGLALSHHPRPMAGAYVLAGHLHPCVSIGGRAHDWDRLPCFWFSERVGVLPAFGAFTGMQAIHLRQAERVFAVAPDRVFELRPKARRI